MQDKQIKAFLDAVDEAKIASYLFVTDINTRYYHDGDMYLNYYDEGNEQIVNVRPTIVNGTKAFEGNITIQSCDILDIHEAVVGCDYEQAKKFLSSLGVYNSEDDKILLKINSSNRPIIPATGDYHNSDFHFISDETYSKLSDEEKEKYDKKKAEEMKRYDLPKGVAARIL